MLIVSVACLLTYFVFKSPGTAFERKYQMTSTEENPGHPLIVAGPSSSCQLVDAFVFVKTHKTGSSTMSNILLRFTESHGLNQLLAK